MLKGSCKCTQSFHSNIRGLMWICGVTQKITSLYLNTMVKVLLWSAHMTQSMTICEALSFSIDKILKGCRQHETLTSHTPCNDKPGDLQLFRANYAKEFNSELRKSFTSQCLPRLDTIVTCSYMFQQNYWFITAFNGLFHIQHFTRQEKLTRKPCSCPPTNRGCRSHTCTLAANFALSIIKCYDFNI